MLNVIICDDNKNDLIKINKIVDKFMVSNRYKYEKHNFFDYDNSFYNVISKKIPFKIYILDIDTPSRSGIDVARDIRKKDNYSPIIFLTGHNDLGLQLLLEDISFTAFISKFIKCEYRLKKCLHNTIKIMFERRIIKINDGISKIYTIALDDILYITKDSVDRKTIIVTDHNEFLIGKSLKSIKEMLPEYFIQTHRACVVNINRTDKIDFKEKEILFDNNVSIDLISNKYKKEVIK